MPFLQMLRDRAAVGSRLQKVRIVSDSPAGIPRPEERRRQMAKLVPRVEVKHLRSKEGVIDEQRVRELYEWQHDEEGFPEGYSRMARD